MSPLSQLWHTPVRQDQRTGTSQASASSSKLAYDGPQQTLRPLRANDTMGPGPREPAGACGRGFADAAMPGVSDGPAPNNSVWIRSGATPNAWRADVRSLMKVAGPHR